MSLMRFTADELGVSRTMNDSKKVKERTCSKCQTTLLADADGIRTHFFDHSRRVRPVRSEIAIKQANMPQRTEKRTPAGIILP